MINWKLRLQRADFWVALVGLLTLLAQQLGFELPSNIAGITNTVLSIAVLVGLVTDPTTDGLSDSQRAMSYEKPHR